jgi:hypothetical protein
VRNLEKGSLIQGVQLSFLSLHKRRHPALAVSSQSMLSVETASAGWLRASTDRKLELHTLDQ